MVKENQYIIKQIITWKRRACELRTFVINYRFCSEAKLSIIIYQRQGGKSHIKVRGFICIGI